MIDRWSWNFTVHVFGLDLRLDAANARWIERTNEGDQRGTGAAVAAWGRAGKHGVGGACACMPGHAGGPRWKLLRPSSEPVAGRAVSPTPIIRGRKKPRQAHARSSARDRIRGGWLTGQVRGTGSGSCSKTWDLTGRVLAASIPRRGRLAAAPAGRQLCGREAHCGLS